MNFLSYKRNTIGFHLNSNNLTKHFFAKRYKNIILKKKGKKKYKSCHHKSNCIIYFFYRLLITPSVSSTFSQLTSARTNENVLALPFDLGKFVLTKRGHVCHFLGSHLQPCAYPHTVFIIDEAAYALFH